MTAKHEHILQKVRGEIVSGKYAPGAMLPTRAAYETRFGATAPTVQKAFDRLRLDGFIEIRHRVGTFVSANPPHLYRFALGFPSRRGQAGRWSRFHEALCREAERLARTIPQELICVEGLEGNPGDALEALAVDMESQRLAGTVFASWRCNNDHPRLRASGVPTVAVGDPDDVPAESGVLLMDYNAMIDRGARYLAERGCREVAVLEDAYGCGRAEFPPDRCAILRRYGLSLAANGYIALPASFTHAARHWVRLLSSAYRDKRPLGVLVTDDNFVEPIVQGLCELGANASENLCLVCHNNFPMPLPDQIPIHQLGFHAGTILRMGLDYLSDRRRGIPRERVMHVECITGDDARNVDV